MCTPKNKKLKKPCHPQLRLIQDWMECHTNYLAIYVLHKIQEPYYDYHEDNTIQKWDVNIGYFGVKIYLLNYIRHFS